MKRFIITVIGILLLAGPAFAQVGITTKNIKDNFDRLTEEQKASVAATIAQQAETNTVNAFTGAVTVPGTEVTVEDVEPWLKLIDHLGAGLVKLAHDLGVEANELVKTPVGVMAMGLVVYHVVGPDLLEIAIGFVWFFMTVPLLAVFFFKSVIPIVKYEEIKVMSWGRERVVHKPIRRKMVFGCDEDFNVDYVFAILLIVNTIVTLCIIV